MRRILCLWAMVVAWPLAAEPYLVGVNDNWARPVQPATRRAWLLDSGCRMARLVLRQDLFAQPAGETLADDDLQAYATAGCTPLLVLFNGAARSVRLADGREVTTTEPAGLMEPIFASGSDYAADYGADDRQAELNPANTWAGFVHAVAERYDGDGVDDAPGSPVADRLILWPTPDRLPDGQRPTDAAHLPAWPGSGYDRLARLLYVGRTAARQANPAVKVGVELRYPESLSFLLADAKHPAGYLLDLVAFEAAGGPGSDGPCFTGEGLVPAAEAMDAVLRDKGYFAPRLLCGNVAVAASEQNGVVQRAAVVKTQVVGASLKLVTALWSTWSDPGPASAGLIREVHHLPPEGRGWQPRDASSACLTFARLLGDGLADGRARFTDQEHVGPQARCYRFSVAGREVLVAWANDPDGEPEREVAARLPLAAGQSYHVCRWDYALRGRADETVTGGDDRVELTLGIDPLYLVAGEPAPTCAPAGRPAPPAAPPWRVTAAREATRQPAALAFDGDADTHWSAVRGGDGGLWWRIDWADGPVSADEVRLRMGRAGGVRVRVQVSLDGEVWRDVSSPAAVGSYTLQRVRLTGRVASRHWRLVFDSATGQELKLYEVELGDRRGAEVRDGS